MRILEELTNPKTLYSRSEILTKPCPVPQNRGLYAWYFINIPPLVISEGCIKKDEKTLLYAGISPKDENSKQNLRKRITNHLFFAQLMSFILIAPIIFLKNLT